MRLEQSTLVDQIKGSVWSSVWTPAFNMKHKGWYAIKQKDQIWHWVRFFIEKFEKWKMNYQQNDWVCLLLLNLLCYKIFKKNSKNVFALTTGFSESFMRHTDAPGRHKAPKMGFRGRQILM